jgi:glycosidase
MTDRFANGNAANDAPVAGVDTRTNYQGGDFAGISARIDEGYFSDLGVSALWISWPADGPDGYQDGSFPDADGCNLDPKTVKSSPMRFTGYHGYWPASPDQVDPRFGTLDELQTLVSKAHVRGIRVLLDLTANHVHTASPWWQQHQGDGWFHLPAEVCSDVGYDNKPITCWFASFLPDLNYSNAAAREAVVDMAVDWVKKTGADGFRFDAVKHLEMQFIEDLRARLKDEFEKTGVPFYVVGETFSGDAGQIAGFVGPARIQGQFDFPTNAHVLKAVARGEEGLDTMDAEVRKAKATYGDAAIMSNFVGNHDMARFLSHAAGSMPCGVWDIASEQAQAWRNPPGQPSDDAPYRKARLALTYVSTIPGIPLLYYGDEFGMPGAGDPDNRRPMRFGGELSDRERGLLDFAKKIGKARAAHAALRTGSWPSPLWAEGGFLVWARTAGNDRAVVVLNASADARTAAVAVSGAGIADGTVLVDALGECGETTVAGGKAKFTVPGRDACILVGK